MIDHSRPPLSPHQRATLPAFTPVPRERIRHDGWTPARQRGFIEALADTGSVRAAAHAVNMTPEGAYLLRRHPEGDEFRDAWEAALALGVQRLEDVAMDRALNGVEIPVYSYGKLIGSRRKYNDRLLMFILRNRAAHRFSEGQLHKLSAGQKTQLAQLKKHWRAEWEAEQATADGDPDAILESLNAKLDRMRLATELPDQLELFPLADPAAPITPDPDEAWGPTIPTLPYVPPRDPRDGPLPLRLPPPYDDPQTDIERHQADWLRHYWSGRIGPGCGDSE